MIKSTDQLTHHQFEEFKNLLLKIIMGHLPAAKVYIFGSRSRGDQRSGSDIDLALDRGDKINILILSKIKSEIEESSLPFSVDIIDLNDISDDFKKMISKDLRLWKN